MLYEIEYDRIDASGNDNGFSLVIDAPRWNPVERDASIRFGKGTLKAIADYGRANGAHLATIFEYSPFTVGRDGHVTGAATSVLADVKISAAAGLGYVAHQPNGRAAR